MGLAPNPHYSGGS